MYYEIYIDSLLLLNFVMNLYCLELVNIILMRTATRKRVILGAALGAVMYLIPFLVPGNGWVKAALFFPLSVAAMIMTVFCPRSGKGFGHVISLLLAVSFFMGGALLFLLEAMPETWVNGALGIMGLGALVFVGVSGRIGSQKQQELCEVEIFGKGGKVTVKALLDTGNALIEPVSGKPVCILEKFEFERLWKDGRPEGFRVIPYHSVGKKQGILYGYPVPEIRIYRGGIRKCCKNVYIGIVEGEIARSGGYSMILNPLLLYGDQKSG